MAVFSVCRCGMHNMTDFFDLAADCRRIATTWMVVMLSTTALQVLAIARIVSALEMRSLCHHVS